MAFRTRDLFVRQRTQTINALRGHVAEHGIVVPSGPAHVGRLGALVQGEDGALPNPVAELARMLLQHIATLTEQIAILEKDLRDRTRHDATAARLMTIPGIGPICASAMTTFAPPFYFRQRARLRCIDRVDAASSIPPAAENASAGHRRWVSVICAVS